MVFTYMAIGILHRQLAYLGKPNANVKSDWHDFWVRVLHIKNNCNILNPIILK